MCGIAGIYFLDKSQPVNSDELRRMTDKIIHRGPDDQGHFIRNNVGLGMRRLSIIDIQGGHQPMHAKNNKATIVFNGEVYNFKELRADLEMSGHTFSCNSDTEVVLRSYEQHGKNFLQKLNGMFGLAIWDEEENELLIARDRIGIKPLYYYQDNEKIIFGSEIKSIFEHRGIIPRVDKKGLPAYMKYGFTPAPMTLFEGIKKIPPAHYLSVKNGKVELVKYWDVNYADKLTGAEDQISEELYELIKSAVNYQMVADVPIGAFLSGGIDSSSIVHAMHDLGSTNINTYSIGFGKGYEAHNELEAAKRFSKDYKTNHHEIAVTPDVAELFPKLISSLDEPLADSSFIMTYLVSKLARESSTVILSGVGGDELFGGYRRYLNVSLDKYIQKIPRVIREKFLSKILHALPADRNSTLFNYIRLCKRYLDSSYLPVYEQYSAYTSIFNNKDESILTGGHDPVDDFHQQYFNECNSPDGLDKLLHYDLKTSLPEQLLMLTDKMSMATSLEARIPYLDHRIVEFSAKIPQHMKINGLNLRSIQKKAFKNKFPNYVLNQKKKGFGAPAGSWMRNELKEMVMDLLGESHLRNQGIFNPTVIQGFLTKHFEMKEDYTDNILALLTFQIWHSEYIKA